MFDALKAEIARLESELGQKWDTVWAEIDRLEGNDPKVPILSAEDHWGPVVEYLGKHDPEAPQFVVTDVTSPEAA